MSRRFLSVFLPLFLLVVAGLTGCGGSSKPITVSITTPASTTIDPGDAVTLAVTVENDSAGEGVTWTLTGTGCTGSACGALSGNTPTGVTYTAPASVTTAFTVSITATSVKKPSVTNSITLNIPATPAITTALGALTAGEVGSAYSVTVDISGGISPYTWTVKSGNLPTGLTLGSSTGTISGTPTASGTYTFTLQVTDSGTPTALTASGAFTIDIAAAPAITFSTSSLAPSVVGDTYTGQVSASGGAGTLTYAVTAGSLPAGLSMAANGAITGKSTAAGTSSFTVTASDAYGDSAKDNLAITIDPVISVSVISLPTGYPGSAYPSTTLAAAGGLGAPYTWTWAAASGSLPAGLNLSTAGVISGIPTTAGTYSVVVTAKDSAGNTGSATLTLTVESTLTITTPTTLPAGEAANLYSQQLAATGGSGSGYTWTANGAGTTALATVGLALQSSGQIVTTGPNPLPGTATFPVTVTDSLAHTASATFTVTIYSVLQITSNLPTGYVGAAYSKTMTGTGGVAPYTWSWSGAAPNSLPPGLNISPGGLVSGSPTTAGTYVPLITIKDSLGFTSQLNVGITVNSAVSVTTTSLPTGYPGVAYPATTLTATGGAGAPYTWTWAAAAGSSLPAGLTLSGAGVITGMPATAGTYNVVVTAKDSAANTGSATLSIVVGAALSITTPTTLPAGESGFAYSQTLAATGGTGAPYTWSTNSAGTTSLQAVGLALLSNGQITNSVPTLTSGTATFTATVTDSLSHTASATFTVKVYTALSISTTTLSGYVGTPLTAQLAATGGDAPYTWSWSGAIPPGLSLSAAGAITGTPTTAGPWSPLVTAKDAAGFSTALPVNIPVSPGVSITPITLPSGYPGTAYPSTTLTAIGGAGTPYTWTWTPASGSSLPPGLILSPAGQIVGTPTTAGTFNVVVTAKDSANNTGSVTLSIVVEAKLAFTPTILPTGAVNETYPSTTLIPAGGTGTGYTFAATGLPGGLTLSASGLLSGTPTTQGTYSSVVVTLTDSVSHTSNTTLSITVNASLAITTASPLPYAIAGTAYSQQLAATGGTGTLTWTATSSNLGGFTLGLSTSGLVSGVPNGPGTASFTANVKDAGGATATVPFTFPIYGALQQSGSALPSTGTTGVQYAGSVNASGGSGNYCWTVTGLSDGLQSPAPNAPCGYIANFLPIQGPPTSAATVNLTVKLTDTTTNLSVTDLYSIVISNPQPLALPPPEPPSLPSATQNQTYSGSITATGGVGPTFTWTVDGNSFSSTVTSISIGDGLSANVSTNNVISITGDPTNTTPANSPISFSLEVQDNYGHSATQSYSIAVNAVSTISGQISPINISDCNGSPITLPTFAVSINTTPVQVTNTDSQGNYSFSNVPNGTYTITPSITGAESIFYPATYTGVVINGNSVTAENFAASLGYTVSGNITYKGLTGTTYVYLQSGCGGGSPGTSISQATLTAGGAYTIRGVPIGDYTINAWMDPLGNGAQNTEDPTGSAALVVSNSNVTGADVTMVAPTQSAPTQVVKLKAIAPTNLGAVISYGSGSVENSSGVEVFTSYVVQWSTTLTGFSSSNSAAFAAVGSHANVWIVNNGIKGITGSFSNNQAYYFRVQGLNPAGAGPWTYYGGPGVVCNTTSCATAVTIGAPSASTPGYYAVSGTVTIPSSITPTGPLYVGVFDQNTNTAYSTEIASPSNSSPNSYTVYAPNGTDYFNFAILDQNNDGLIGAVGDISNTQGNNSQAIVVNNQPLTNQDITLSAAASTATVATSYVQSVSPGGTNTGYGINFDVTAGNGSKLPVSVTLMSGPNILQPIDLSNYCQGCGSPQWQYQPFIDTAVPKVGDSYTFDVTYSDTTTETLTAAVTAVLGPGDLVTALSPNPATTNATTTPTFKWTYPASPGNYTYQFYLQQNSGPEIWQIPSNNSNANGFIYTQIPMPAGLMYGTDPTDNTNTPLYTTLTSGIQYNWSIDAQDANGNSASVSTYFTPQ